MSQIKDLGPPKTAKVEYIHNSQDDVCGFKRRRPDLMESIYQLIGCRRARLRRGLALPPAGRHISAAPAAVTLFLFALDRSRIYLRQQPILSPRPLPRRPLLTKTGFTAPPVDRVDRESLLRGDRTQCDGANSSPDWPAPLRHGRSGRAPNRKRMRSSGFWTPAPLPTGRMSQPHSGKAWPGVDTAKVKIFALNFAGQTVDSINCPSC
jgi:hypothetical protein